MRDNKLDDVNIDVIVSFIFCVPSQKNKRLVESKFFSGVEESNVSYYCKCLKISPLFKLTEGRLNTIIKVVPKGPHLGPLLFSLTLRFFSEI